MVRAGETIYLLAHLVLFFSVPNFHIFTTHLKPCTEGRAARRRIDTAAAAERAVRTCFIMVAYDLCLRPDDFGGGLAV